MLVIRALGWADLGYGTGARGIFWVGKCQTRLAARAAYHEVGFMRGVHSAHSMNTTSNGAYTDIEIAVDFHTHK